MKPIILASASPRRKEILEKYNIPFVVEVSNVDEDCRNLKPEELLKIVTHLSVTIF